MDKVKLSLALNQAAVAIPHMIPEMSPGRIAFGYTAGLLHLAMLYIPMYRVLVARIPV
jgi:hypothetical protein